MVTRGVCKNRIERTDQTKPKNKIFLVFIFTMVQSGLSFYGPISTGLVFSPKKKSYKKRDKTGIYIYIYFLQNIYKLFSFSLTLKLRVMILSIIFFVSNIFQKGKAIFYIAISILCHKYPL